ncbi:hypothetical protein DK846_10780 [Methanospirillum lacunae]|uniref:Uncharacterized protein n=1 Tax=Methanospirillum lacunae TaxID=668570 RepID=A0A2V2MTI6_9EURY|nr:hypothetical protein DK846_10780 [Methanospirillum lacunae]
MALQEVGLYETSGRDSTSTPSNNQKMVNTGVTISIGNSVLNVLIIFTAENTLDLWKGFTVFTVLEEERSK